MISPRKVGMSWNFHGNFHEISLTGSRAIYINLYTAWNPGAPSSSTPESMVIMVDARDEDSDSFGAISISGVVIFFHRGMGLFENDPSRQVERPRC